jgi:hypothetical protein
LWKSRGYFEREGIEKKKKKRFIVNLPRYVSTNFFFFFNHPEKSLREVYACFASKKKKKQIESISSRAKRLRERTRHWPGNRSTADTWTCLWRWPLPTPRRTSPWRSGSPWLRRRWTDETLSADGRGKCCFNVLIVFLSRYRSAAVVIVVASERVRHGRAVLCDSSRTRGHAVAFRSRLNPRRWKTCAAAAAAAVGWTRIIRRRRRRRSIVVVLPLSPRRRPRVFRGNRGRRRVPNSYRARAGYERKYAPGVRLRFRPPTPRFSPVFPKRLSAPKKSVRFRALSYRSPSLSLQPSDNPVRGFPLISHRALLRHPAKGGGALRNASHLCRFVFILATLERPFE